VADFKFEFRDYEGKKGLGFERDVVMHLMQFLGGKN